MNYGCRFAQHVQLNETQSDIRGSPLYMAPEILLSRCYDPSADLWSIGCILHECLFGFAPYRSKSMDELLQKIKIKQKIMIPPTGSAAKPSAICLDFLERLLIHEPKQRIGFADFFAHKFLDLANVLNSTEQVQSKRSISRPIIFLTIPLPEIGKSNCYVQKSR